jgi:glycosyltransferase involved in cell wall biosynthesis
VRICFVTLDFPPFRGSGLTIYAETVVRGLVARGHDVTVVASSRPERERLEGSGPPVETRIVRVPSGPADWIGLGWQAARYLHAHRHEFDVIHFANVHFAYAYWGPFVASAFQSFRQQLSSHHGRPYHTDRRNYLFRLLYYSGARWAMERPAIRRADHLIMSSLSTQQEFVGHYGVPPDRTTLVYLGIDLHRFESLPPKAQARQQLDLPGDAPLLLYVGFSTPRKGVEYLARALRRMQTPARLVMVGKWEAGYPERFLADLGDARSRVHLAGYVPDEDLPVYFAAADLFVLPTLLEGFGIPLVEAMAAGLPLVTTSGGSAGEVAGDAGLVVPPADEQSLAKAIDRVLNDAGLAYRLGEIGTERARELFSDQRMAAAIESVYHRCGLAR